jgi:XTP/dITP diphosphohydrolase
MEIIIATRNEGKIREIREALETEGIDFRTFEELDDWPEIEETGDTLEENALIKAFVLRNKYNLPVLADDSGLMVDKLDGRPGVNSARYAGPEGDSDQNMALLLKELKGVPEDERTARFVSVLALAVPGGEVHVTHGECAGVILKKRKGKGGFGYDPVFQPSAYDCSMAQLSLEEKNAISHRGKALSAIKEILQGMGSGLGI